MALIQSDRIFRDVRDALRFLTARPGWTAVVVLSLALGIGANTAVFSIVKAVLLEPLPYRNPAELVFMWGGQSPEGGPGLSGADIVDWREQAASLAGLAPYIQSGTAAVGTDGTDTVGATYIGYDVFDVLGVTPFLGRGLLEEDNQPDAPSLVVLSYGFWQSRLGGDPEAIGETLLVDGESREIAGVMPPGFFFPRHDIDLWMNVSPFAAQLSRRGNPFFRVVGRRRAGASVDGVRAEIATINRRLDGAYPQRIPRDTGVFDIEAIVLGNYRLALLSF